MQFQNKTTTLATISIYHHTITITIGFNLLPHHSVQHLLFCPKKKPQNNYKKDISAYSK
jgi:hypothetical protein